VARELVWDDYALSYDRVVGRMPYYLAALRRHERALVSSNSRVVADLGAGTGNLVVRLLRRGMKVLAVDPSRGMLGHLAEKLSMFPEDTPVAVWLQSAESLDQIEDRSVDGVSVLLAFFDMNEPERAFREAIRILRAGGTMAITEPKLAFQMQPILDYCRAYLQQNGLLQSHRSDLERVFKANAAINPATRKDGSPLRIERIYRGLIAAGFTPIKQQDSHMGECATVVGKKPAKVNWNGLRQALAETEQPLQLNAS
jgi:ubiquinone/menaquinone biosynthesis C-methylase UbiE